MKCAMNILGDSSAVDWTSASLSPITWQGNSQLGQPSFMSLVQLTSHLMHLKEGIVNRVGVR